MAVLNDVLDAVTPEYLSRKYGADPLLALIKTENHQEARQALPVIMSALSPSQQEVLTRYVSGQSLYSISKEINRPISTVSSVKNSIPKRLKELAGFEHRAEIAREIIGLSLKRKKNRRVKRLLEELNKCDALAEALLKLSKALKPLETPLTVHKTPKTDWLFELQTKKPPEKCRLPEYFKNAFGDDLTVCTLCKKCR